jgi:hypothetical protein
MRYTCHTFTNAVFNLATYGWMDGWMILQESKWMKRLEILSEPFEIFVVDDDEGKLRFSLQTSTDQIHVKSEHWCTVGRMCSKLDIYIVSSTHIIIDCGNTT